MTYSLRLFFFLVGRKNRKKKNQPKSTSLDSHYLINKQDNKTNVPGPGAYIKVEVTKVKSAVSGAVFKSESERIAKMNENFDNLGPGSYKAFGQLKKQNFHYNMKQSWI